MVCMSETLTRKSSKLMYRSMCYAYDILVGNKESEDIRYEMAVFQERNINKVLKYFEDIEEYEKCALIKELKDSLYE